MGKYKGKFEKGMNVHIIESTWRSNKGTIRHDKLYSIRSIGPKKAVLDRIDQQTCTKLGYSGESFHLYTTEERDTGIKNGNDYAQWYPISWEELFYPAKKAGWDPDKNT